ncbi:MAG: ABC transporter permease [Actinomycetota bacterium]
MTGVATPPAPPPAAPEPPEPPAPSGRQWRIERRLQTPWYLEVAGIFAGIALAVLTTAILIALAGSDVLESFRALYRGGFGTRAATIETLVQATPLIFTGLAAAFAFRAKVWNIGGEGQLFAGAMGAYWASLILDDSLPGIVLWPVCFAMAMLMGAGWAGIAAVLRTRFGVNEIITTVMLNFIVLNLLNFLLNGAWQDPASFYAQTDRMSDAFALPRILEPGRLHLGFVIALLTAALVWFILNRTSFGYEVRGIGANPRVASYGGIVSNRIIIATMLISGAIAGLAGASELLGTQLRLQPGISNEFGFTGIIIALVARLRPAGVIIAAIAAGALTNGATTMQITTGVPAALVDVITGLALVFVLVTSVVVNYRLRRVHSDG